MRGYRRPPRAMIVTPDAPVKAVKKAQAIRTTSGTPPGIPPSSARDSRANRFGVSPLARMKPAKVNSGMAIRVGDAAIRYNSIKIAAGSISAV